MCFGRNKSPFISKEEPLSVLKFKRRADPLTVSSFPSKRARKVDIRCADDLVSKLGFQRLEDLGLGPAKGVKDEYQVLHSSNDKKNTPLRRRNTLSASTHAANSSEGRLYESGTIIDRSGGFIENDCAGGDVVDLDVPIWMDIARPIQERKKAFEDHMMEQMASGIYSDKKNRNTWRRMYDPFYVTGDSETESENENESDNEAAAIALSKETPSFKASASSSGLLSSSLNRQSNSRVSARIETQSKTETETETESETESDIVAIEKALKDAASIYKQNSASKTPSAGGPPSKGKGRAPDIMESEAVCEAESYMEETEEAMLRDAIAMSKHVQASTTSSAGGPSGTSNHDSETESDDGDELDIPRKSTEKVKGKKVRFALDEDDATESNDDSGESSQSEDDVGIEMMELSWPLEEIRSHDAISPLKLLEGYAVMDDDVYFCHLNEAIREYYSYCSSKVARRLSMEYPLRSTPMSRPYLFVLSEFVAPEFQQAFIDSRIDYISNKAQAMKVIKGTSVEDLYYAPKIPSAPNSPLRRMETASWKEGDPDGNIVTKRVDLLLLNLYWAPRLHKMDRFWTRVHDIVECYPAPTVNNALPILTAHRKGKIELFNGAYLARQYADERTLNFIDEGHEIVNREHGPYSLIQEEQCRLGDCGAIAFSHLPRCAKDDDIVGMMEIVNEVRGVCDGLESLYRENYNIRELALKTFPLFETATKI